jgi:MFS superfamily sulfate permease-like transporter
MRNSTKQSETPYVNQNQSEAKQSGEAMGPGGPVPRPSAAVPPTAVSPVVAPPVVPKDGLAGLKDNWRTDIVSGLILFLIALPLSLAIAIASGMPPIAGLIAAAVGGMLVSQVSGSYVTINGPAAGLITVILGSVTRLGGGDAGQHAALAAIVVAGVSLFILGKFKAGELGDYFPLSVVHGMLAAIGIIIMSKQAYIMLGIKPTGREPLELIINFPQSLANINPELAIIGIVSLFILVLHALSKSKVVKAIPIPLVVVAIAIGLTQYFGLSHQHHYEWNGHDYVIDPSKCLVLLPANIFSAFTTPDWSQIASGAFWFFLLTLFFFRTNYCLCSRIGDIAKLCCRRQTGSIQAQK